MSQTLQEYWSWWRRNWQPTAVFLPGESRGRGAWQPTAVFLPGESRGRGAWRATVHGVTESQACFGDETITTTTSTEAEG